MHIKIMAIPEDITQLYGKQHSSIACHCLSPDTITKAYYPRPEITIASAKLVDVSSYLAPKSPLYLIVPCIVQTVLLSVIHYNSVKNTKH